MATRAKKAIRGKPKAKIPRERGGGKVPFTEEQMIAMRGGLTVERYRRPNKKRMVSASVPAFSAGCKRAGAYMRCEIKRAKIVSTNITPNNKGTKGASEGSRLMCRQRRLKEVCSLFALTVDIRSFSVPLCPFRQVTRASPSGEHHAMSVVDRLVF